MSPTKRKHHEDCDSDEEQMIKMSRLLASQLYACLLCCEAFAFYRKYIFSDRYVLMILCDVIFRGGHNGNTGNQDSWNYSSFQHTSLSGLQNHRVFTPFPIFAMDQPLALTKHASDSVRSTALLPGPNTERQQVRLQ